MKDPADSTTVVPTKKLATDPVCGMTADPANAASVEYKGAKVYFCSKGCAAKFQSEPAKYLQKMQDILLVQIVREGGTDGRLYLPHAPGSA
jgi:YHS domain-containing protein